MNIKDIVNRDIVNLSNCEQEPIHIPGSIQPYGFLLAMHTGTMLIEYCSGNIFDFTGITYSQCLGKTFTEVFGQDAQQLFLDYTSQAAAAVSPPLLINAFGKKLLCTVHHLAPLYVAEFELAESEDADISQVYNQTIHFVSDMAQSDTLRDLCQRVAEHTRAITNYDRVMIYRFDKDYNGEVFAESKVDHIEPFLGLHYPHTDIPAQARRLYLTNLMRIIADVNEQPVPIYTIDDVPGKTLDLSMSYLRSVSPIHIEYLQNMGVGGTLTISLIHDGRLWGLITCHHYSAKYLPLYTRIAAQMQGYFLTSQINVRQLNENYKMGASVNISLEKLLDETHEPTLQSFANIVRNPSLLTLCHASGAAVIFEGKVYKIGNTPSDEEIKKLSYWLNTYTRHGEFSTSRLADIYPDAKAFASTGAGIIYHSLSGLENDAIIWFAPETKEEVLWAGDPSKAIVKNENGLSPRNSFSQWKQILQYQSKVWEVPELLATATFAHALQKHITLIMISEEEKKQRLLTEKLQDANTELENINWISSHDLKEPLRKIQIFSSKILDKEQATLSQMAVLSLNKVIKSASKMQQLLADINSYNKVRQLHEVFGPVDLNNIVQSVAEDLGEDIAEKKATLSCGLLPTVSGVEFLLRQLFLNLLRNAMKFAKKDIPLEVSVTAAELPVYLPESGGKLYYNVIVNDNGIGFDNVHSESIFKVFTRLHGQAEYEGSGVGLALCKKIMQNHKGNITGSGQLGIGAAFSLYFPVPAEA